MPKLIYPNEYIIQLIFNYINNDNKLYKIFNHHNNKYLLKELIKYSLIIHLNNIPYRVISNFTSINWNTIYKFIIKLCKYDIITNIFNNKISKYISEINNTNVILYTDTSFINNQLGNELVNYNPYNRKHKSTKISIIIDNFNIPISIKSYDPTIHDAKILNIHLTELKIDHPNLFDNKKKIIADSAYDSNKLRNKLKELELGDLITLINRRNIKDKSKLRKNNLFETILLNSRHKIENIICRYKKCKKINNRYDRKLITFNYTLMLSSLFILMKATNYKL